MSDEQWRDILVEQPEHGQRILARFATGSPRIVTYNRFCYELWKILHWKKMPQGKS